MCKESKLTEELHTDIFNHLQEGSIGSKEKTLLHMYLFMLEYVDVLGHEVTLRGLKELFESLHVEMPEVLKELDY